jgi:hypothetical protein
LEANADGALLVFETTIVNSRTIEALGSATLTVDNSVISNTTTSALILAAGSGVVQLETATISGGTLKTSGTSAAIVADDGTNDVINGATIASKSLVEATFDATLTLSGGAVGSDAIVETLSGGTLVVSGTVVNSGGTLFASGAQSLIEISRGAVVNGGVVEVGNGIVDIQSGGSANVTFLSTGSGGLEIADTKGDPTAFTGVVSGFGGTSHANHTQFIDLTAVNYVSGVVTDSYSSTTTSSGVLTISSGGSIVATIDFAGAYVTSDFHLSGGSGGSGTIITDPTVVGGGVQSANIALLGNYIAAGFVRRRSP